MPVVVYGHCERMDYEAVSRLVKKFEDDPQVLKAYEQIYEQNNCNFFRKIKAEDIEEGEILSKRNDGIKNDKLKDFEKTTNQNFYVYTEQILKKLVKEHDEINKTFDKIEKCNNTYNDVDTLLSKYKNNIKTISDDIKNIENLTNSMDDKIQNRKKILELLNVYIKIILVTPQLINDITNNEIDDIFINNIHILNKKIENCRHCLYDSYPSINSSYTELEKLKSKAINKIYNFFLSKLNDIINKKGTIYTVQEQLIKFHMLNSFLYNNNKNAYTYIIKEYITILNRTYYNLFQAYISNFVDKQIQFDNGTTIGKCSPPHFQNVINPNLENENNSVTTSNVLPYTCVEQNKGSDAKGCEQNGVQNPEQSDATGLLVSGLTGIGQVGSSSIILAKNKMMDMFGFSYKNKNINDKKENIFLLNNRHHVLNDIKNAFLKNVNKDESKESDKQSVVPTICIPNNAVYHFEHIYKLINKLFIDTGTSEYLFILKFFKNYENIDFLFLEIYSKTISVCFNYFINFINTTFDFISLFLVYIINIYNAYIIRNRHILSLYEFVEKMQNIVWNKLHYIINENYKSIITTTKLDPNQVQNKKTVYDLLYRTKLNAPPTPTDKNILPINSNEEKSVQKIGEKQVGDDPNCQTELKTEDNIKEGSQIESSDKSNAELKNDGIHNNKEIQDISPNKTTDLVNPSFLAHNKPDVHSVTKSFSDFYSSLIILNELAYNYEFSYREKCSEGKQTSQGKSENDEANGADDIHNELTKKYAHLNNFISNFENMIINVLLNMSNNFQNKNDKLLFLINNYYHIITILKSNKMDEEKINPFEKLIEKDISSYIDLQLNKYIKDIISFVSKHEQIFENGEQEKNNTTNNNVNVISQVDTQLMESTALYFTNEWKQLLKNVEQEILKSFSNRVNSINILKTLNTKILLYFTRYHQLIKKIFENLEMPLYVQNLPSIDIILTQIKKNSKHIDNEEENI
ncbi:vacuolar protein sorting-associated protein 52, putative [Plasmodium chabaudi chabaudi]|uniref:Vacuolar protein sorting-associated protein 52, putative n=1 Tax=Plasmodium chabaudi chabaudi TaxID=31271 RepID=A0A4V0KDC3_PLACU|nr:vacuolar protein sorting-associated protein 52, putative [Plasmodium chabaudi chabaudi]VTZ70388.1 vacuolar protein sorting-associated protein 52, putative [Plasmodium chabaudi chabaudi]|eukprot:XP_744905.2 vacuolar protein sorting-associated protein 52, putative [Plasmodium chabaudi chabaudi]